MADFSYREIAHLRNAVRAKRPLVQNITNFVAMTISANVLLALGASPAMVHAAEEVREFGQLTDALVINIGTLSPSGTDAMKLAAKTITARRKPWVLDPVACGATTLRTSTATGLLDLKPSVVRGNAGEILALAGASGAGSKGADSLVGSDSAIGSAKALARASLSIVAVTGEIDYVTDGERIVSISGGHALMPFSTAIGCSLSASVGAFASIAPPFEATIAALTIFATAGSIAGDRCPNGPGHFPAELCDALYGLGEADLAARTTVTVVA